MGEIRSNELFVRGTLDGLCKWFPRNSILRVAPLF